VNNVTGKDLGLKRFRGRAITVREMSLLLRTSERWVELRMKEGTFPFPWYPVNPKKRIADSADVDEWLAKIKVAAGSAQLPQGAIKKIKNKEGKV
jgi:predicted DNA-binding transcriptional regulator AlpA